jgi:hypothetical protein
MFLQLCFDGFYVLTVQHDDQISWWSFEKWYKKIQFNYYQDFLGGVVRPVQLKPLIWCKERESLLMSSTWQMILLYSRFSTNYLDILITVRKLVGVNLLWFKKLVVLIVVELVLNLSTQLRPVILLLDKVKLKLFFWSACSL